MCSQTQLILTSVTISKTSITPTTRIWRSTTLATRNIKPVEARRITGQTNTAAAWRGTFPSSWKAVRRSQMSNTSNYHHSRRVIKNLCQKEGSKYKTLINKWCLSTWMTLWLMSLCWIPLQLSGTSLNLESLKINLWSFKALTNQWVEK